MQLKKWGRGLLPEAFCIEGEGGYWLKAHRVKERLILLAMVPIDFTFALCPRRDVMELGNTICLTMNLYDIFPGPFSNQGTSLTPPMKHPPLVYVLLMLAYCKQNYITTVHDKFPPKIRHYYFRYKLICAFSVRFLSYHFKIKPLSGIIIVLSPITWMFII